jgi:hypothetical protein
MFIDSRREDKWFWTEYCGYLPCNISASLLFDVYSSADPISDSYPERKCKTFGDTLTQKVILYHTNLLVATLVLHGLNFF